MAPPRWPPPPRPGGGPARGCGRGRCRWGGDRRRAGHRHCPRDLAVGHHDHRRHVDGATERGGGAVFVPGCHPGGRRRGDTGAEGSSARSRHGVYSGTVAYGFRRRGAFRRGSHPVAAVRAAPGAPELLRRVLSARRRGGALLHKGVGAVARRKRTTNRLHAGGAVALVGGLVLALSFLPGATGVPLVLEHVQRVALGDGAWLIPLAGVLGGIALLRASEHSRLGRRAWGAALIALVSVAAYHARVPRGAEWSTGLNASGGGVVGGALLWVLRRAFGETGAWLMLALSAIGGALLWSNVSLAAAVGGMLSAIQWTAAELVQAALAIWQLGAGGAVAAVSIVTSSAAALAHAIWRGARAAAGRVGAVLRPMQRPATTEAPRGPTGARPLDTLVAEVSRPGAVDGEKRVAGVPPGRGQP